MNSFTDRLSAVLASSSEFGKEAHVKMAHSKRQYHPQAEDQVQEAAVMHLIFPVKGEWHFTLIKRSSRNPNDQHKGQMALAGGAYETSDRDILQTAIRETEEEIGVKLDQKEVRGSLTPLYISVSKFNVHPFIAILDYQPDFILQKSEVDSLVTVPLTDLMDDSNKKKTNLEIWPDVVLHDVPHYELKGEVVWGATAMMLSELEEVLRRACL